MSDRPPRTFLVTLVHGDGMARDAVRRGWGAWCVPSVTHRRER